MMTSTNWIFGSFKKDFGLLFLSAFAGYFALIFSHQGWILPLIFGVSLFFEASHIYSTSWRIYFNPQERGRSWIYWGFPLVFFVTLSFWSFMNIPYFIEVNFFLNLFHHFRQFYGVNKWYQKINFENNRWFDYTVYFVMFVPSFLLESRIGRVTIVPKEVIPVLHQAYYLLLSIILAREFYLVIFKKAKVYRIFILLLILAANGICLVTDNEKLSMAHLALNHGAIYLAIVALSMGRLQMAPVKNFYINLILVAISSILLFHLSRFFMLGVGSALSLGDDAILKLLLIVYNTCVFSHYFIDGYIWRGKHPDAKKIYAVT